MKKVLSILTVVVFFLAVSAPVYSADVTSPVIVNVDDEKPKAEKSESKKEAKTEKKSAECQTKAKKSDCSSKKSKTCGDKGK